MKVRDRQDERMRGKREQEREREVHQIKKNIEQGQEDGPGGLGTKAAMQQDQTEARMSQRRIGKQGGKRNPVGSRQDKGSVRIPTAMTDPRDRSPSHPTPSSRPTRCLFTICRVWPEGNLDLKLPVGIFDGGKWQEGVRCLSEVGYHSLCREKTVSQTPVGKLAHAANYGWSCPTWHLQIGEGFDLALPVGGSAHIGAGVLWTN